MQVSVTNNHGVIAEKIDGGTINITPSATHQQQTPDILASEEAQRLWSIAQQQGWVDHNLQPIISQPKAAILASVMADVLKLSPRWSAFEQLWGIPELANKLSKAQNCQYYAESQREYEKALI